MHDQLPIFTIKPISYRFIVWMWYNQLLYTINQEQLLTVEAKHKGHRLQSFSESFNHFNYTAKINKAATP